MYQPFNRYSFFDARKWRSERDHNWSGSINARFTTKAIIKRIRSDKIEWIAQKIPGSE